MITRLGRTVAILDELTNNLACQCSKDVFDCNCRTGISKIVGSLLDQYFELDSSPCDFKKIWNWCANLNFHDQKTAQQSKAVQVLRDSVDLRHQILAHVFGLLTCREEILRIKWECFDWHGHAGFNFQASDYEFLIDYAYKFENAALWGIFIVKHQYFGANATKGVNVTRRRMRAQARANPVLMVEWARSSQNDRLETRSRLMLAARTRSTRRRRVRTLEVRAANRKFFSENREIIESGQHWNCLVRFAMVTLENPDRIEEEFGDPILVRNALANCLGLVGSKIPDFSDLAKLRSNSQTLNTEMVLHAACIEIMNRSLSLQSVDVRLLRVLRTRLNVYYGAVSNGARAGLKAEIDRLIFPDAGSAELFLRESIEPQLEHSQGINSSIWLLDDAEIFFDHRAALSVEWLGRFDQLAPAQLERLFDIAVLSGDLKEIKKIITLRCAGLLDRSNVSAVCLDDEHRRMFWFIRAFFFVETPPIGCVAWLFRDKETIFKIEERSSKMSSFHNSSWPSLPASKVEAVLDAFIDRWPKVELPNSWGTGSPKEEIAYRFLRELIWSIDSDTSEDAIPVLNRLLIDPRYGEMHNDLKSIRAGKLRQNALRDFVPPTPREVVNQLDRDEAITVEALRQLLLQELTEFQKAIVGGEFDSASRFYEKGERLGEVKATQIISERLSLRLEPKDITVTPEHQLKNANRSDFTAAKLIGGRRRLLVTEVKGQWHEDLYVAASEQLFERYSIHPDAEQQGIYLVLWFGPSELVAGRKKHGITSAEVLKSNIEAKLPLEIRGLVDVFVLDVSLAS